MSDRCQIAIRDISCLDSHDTDKLNLDSSEGFKEAYTAKQLVFPGKIIISSKEKAEIEAKRAYNGLVLWSDGSKIDSEAIGAGIAWKSSNI